MMWQWLVIVPLVVASAAYAGWAVMPVSTRVRATRWLSQRLSGSDTPLARLARRLERAALPTGSGCDACPASRIDPAADRKPPAR
jgi:hypothetical protein